MIIVEYDKTMCKQLLEVPVVLMQIWVWASLLLWCVFLPAGTEWEIHWCCLLQGQCGRKWCMWSGLPWIWFTVPLLSRIRSFSISVPLVAMCMHVSPNNSLSNYAQVTTRAFVTNGTLPFLSDHVLLYVDVEALVCLYLCSVQCWQYPWLQLDINAITRI